MIAIPSGLTEKQIPGEAWPIWLGKLPARVEALLADWDLISDGLATHGARSLVVPVRQEDTQAVLKISWPDVESEHEHLALRHWQGNGAVQLLRADPRRNALLLERLGPQDLTEVDDIAACQIVAGLYPQLHSRPAQQLRRLTSYAKERRVTLRALPRNAPIPRRFVEHAAALCGDFATDAQTDGVTIHANLHHTTVMAGARAPWLAIAPTPLNGDPHCEPAPMLWHRFDEVASEVRKGVRRRFHSLIDTADLDEDRARDWVIVRAVDQATSRLRETQAPSVADRKAITQCVAITKAVQD